MNISINTTYELDEKEVGKAVYDYLKMLNKDVKGNLRVNIRNDRDGFVDGIVVSFWKEG